MRNILLVIAVLNILLIGGLWFGYQSMSDHRAEYERLTGDIAKEETTRKSAASLRRTLEAILPARTKLDSFFYQHSDDDGVRFVEEIEDLARITGVELQVSGANFTGIPPDAVFRMDTRVVGTWTQVNQFMQLLEKFPARVLVTRWFVQSENSAKELTPNSRWSGVVDFDLMSIKEPTDQHAGN
jgi:hypothetical protein